MTKNQVLLILACLISFLTQAQFNYVLVTNGLQDTYESGNTSFALGDIDGDGDIDIVSVGDHASPSPNQHGIMVFKNNGNGTLWTKTMSGNFGYGSAALGDVNNDGYMDVAFGIHHHAVNTDFGDQKLEVVLGDSTGGYNWTPWDDNLAQQTQTWGMAGCDFADVNSDGLLDLGSNAFGSPDGVWVYKNNGNGTWSVFSGANIGNSGCTFKFGDFDKDGKIDFMTNNTQFNGLPGQAWKGNGLGQFTSIQTGLPMTGSTIHHTVFALGDIDNDGAEDIALYWGGALEVYTFNTTTNSWISKSNGLYSLSTVHRVALGDMDRDGFVDLVAISSGSITIFKGDGTGNWVNAATIPVINTNCYDLKVADLDNNGFLDIVYWGKNQSGVNMLRVLLNDTITNVLEISPVFPKPSITFCHGSVQFLKWTSAVPLGNSATVTIDFSSTGPTGPFSNIVTNAPNSGTYQWTVPGIASTNCYLKYVITTGTSTDIALMSGSFTIDTCGANPILPAPMTGQTIICPGDSASYSVAFVPGAISYTWTLPSGWIGTSSTNTINAKTGIASGNVSVVVQPAFGPLQQYSLYVTVIVIDTGVIKSGFTLTSSEPGASYQWINCVNGTHIQGAVQQNFTPSANGTYAVIVSKYGCTDTSGCQTLILNPLTGSTIVCPGSASTYSTITPAISYTWTLPSGWIGSSVTNTIHATSGTTSGFITVVPQTASGPLQPESLYVTAVVIDTSVIQNGITMTSLEAGASYQWINCVTGMHIQGAVNQNFNPAANGTYAVIITKSGCIDTSSCIQFVMNPLTGPTTVCKGNLSTYSIPVVPGAISYTWTLPSGWIGTSTSNSMSAIAGQFSGNVSVVVQPASGPSIQQSLYVTVISVDTGVTLNGHTLTSVEPGAAYQWINCTNGSAVNGAANQSFTPLINGSYAVIVTKTGCADTSGCHYVAVTGVNLNEKNSFLTIIPNPSRDYFVISSSDIMNQIEIHNVMGQRVFSASSFTNSIEVDFSAMPSGLYFLSVVTNREIISQKLIKTE